MAASDVPSQPARPTLRDRLGILSSSPSFPDLQELIETKAKAKAKPQTLRSGSAAAPIPADTSTAFTSASNLLRLSRTTGDVSVDQIDDSHPPVAKKAPAKRVRKIVKEPKVSKAPNEPKAAKASKSGKIASKRVAKEVIVLSSDGISPKSTRHVEINATGTDNQHADDVGIQSAEGTPLQAQPWKRFKAPISSGLKETEEATIASPNLAAKAKSLKKKTKSQTASKYYAKERDPEHVQLKKSDAKAKRPKASTPEPTNLEPALQRRVDWTPAKPDTMISHTSPDSFDTQEAFTLTHTDEVGSSATNPFKSLHDTYGHRVADEGIAAIAKQQTVQVLGKRKIIEMISVHLPSKPTEASREPSPARVRAQKKKPRTITELATAAYAPKIIGEQEGDRDDSLLEYFTVQDPEQNASKGAVASGKGKASKVTSNKKKAAQKKPVLLSPQSAIRQSAAQDFVFGTASQLAREKSPTFLRDLHTAMKASTIVEEDHPFASPSTEDMSRSKLQSKGLWSVSARDEDGELADVEIIDLIDSPALPPDNAILDPWTQLPPEAGSAETETAHSSVIEIDSRPGATSQSQSSRAAVSKSHFFINQKMTLNAAAAISPKSPEESFPVVTQSLEEQMPPPSNQQQTQEEVRESTSQTTAPTSKQRPKYEIFTDVKLAKEISKFGFKAVKTRTGMISLLDQCWKRKVQSSVAGAAFSTSSVLASPKRKLDGANDSITKSPSQVKKARRQAKKATDVDTVVAEASAGEVHNSPIKKPGRTRNAAAAATAAAAAKAAPSTPKRKKAVTRAEPVVEDFDAGSEVEACESSPEQLFTPSSAEADVTIGEDTQISLNLSPTARQSSLFSYITKAVTSASRTTDPEKPSWHEKMLMYDPVILEDLTAWLNSGELTKLGYDDEVSTQDVKKWCEMRSVCCIWKGTWRGTERKRV